MSTTRIVAVAGATGRFGQYLSEIFLSPEYKPRFKEVRLLTRQKTDQTAKWEQKGAKVVEYDENSVPEALAGAEVVINVIGSKGHHMKDKIVENIPSSAKLYFPSEFGVDHTLPGYTHAEWVYKKDHAKQAEQRYPNLRVCRIYCGFFLETTVGPWFGFNTKEGHYEGVGSVDQPVSVTAFDDVARSVAELSSGDISKVPSTVRLSGDRASMNEVAEIMKAHGAGDIRTSVIDLEPYKQKAISEHLTPDKFLRFAMGEGKINFGPGGLGNDNELVNPEETRWKWKKFKDIAAEHQGVPFKDF